MKTLLVLNRAWKGGASFILSTKKHCTTLQNTPEQKGLDQPFPKRQQDHVGNPRRKRLGPGQRNERRQLACQHATTDSDAAGKVCGVFQNRTQAQRWRWALTHPDKSDARKRPAGRLMSGEAVHWAIMYWTNAKTPVIAVEGLQPWNGFNCLTTVLL